MGLDFLGLQRLVPTISEEAAVIPTTDLELWLLSDSGLFQQSDGTIPSTLDNDVVGYWTDQSGKDNHVTQATTSKKPVLINGVVNGLPIVRWDLSDDVLENSTIVEVFTVFVVAANASAGFPSGNHYIFAQDAGNFVMLQTSGGGGLVRVVSGVNVINDSNPWGTSFQIGTVTAAPGDMDFYLDGSLVGSVAGFTAHSGTFTLGNNAASPLGWGGDIAEVIAYSSVLSNEDLNAVGNYLGTRYGIVWSDV